MVKSSKNRKREKKKLVITLVILILVLLFMDFILMRNLLPSQLDDVRPGRYCGDYMEKVDYLMVVPRFDNVSILNNRTWCNQILALNKTIGMHGVTHSPFEFAGDLNQSYILGGLEEFKQCFGKYPSVFTAPQLGLSNANEKFLDSLNIEVHGWSFFFTHKIYHCVDQNQTSYLVALNKIISII